ncbi:MAG: AAA family ATPase [Deltaproteobacteria bacterium]
MKPVTGRGKIEMKIFGAIGRIGSGKDAVVDYLSGKYNLHSVSVGDMVREMAEEKGVSLTRKNLEQVASQTIRNRGKDFFMKRVIEHIRAKDWNRASVTGIRTPDHVRYLKDEIGENFVLIHVYVEDPHIRYKRLTRRDREGDPHSYEDFLEQDRKEEEAFHIKQAASMADYSLDNSGTLEDLHRQVDIIPALNKLKK